MREIRTRDRDFDLNNFVRAIKVNVLGVKRGGAWKGLEEDGERREHARVEQTDVMAGQRSHSQACSLFLQTLVRPC